MKKKGQYIRVRLDSGQHRRIFLTAVFLTVAAFLPVVLQLYSLMIVNFPYYSELALKNQSRTTRITPERGEIYDCNMNVLACSEKTENIYLNPHELKQSGADLNQIARDLGEILRRDPRWIEEQGRDMKKRYKQIVAGIDEKTGAAVREYINTNHLHGIHLEPNTRRVYPYGKLASQVIGFANASNTGSEGIEAFYNEYLEGDPGKVITTKGNNEMDLPFSYEDFMKSRKGDSVILTLDTTVQTCLEKQMEAAIMRYDVQNGAFGMVMNVNTGEILAMATLGGYDPNHYLEIADPREAEKLLLLQLAYEALPPDSEAYGQARKVWQNARHQAQLKQWRNRCISDGYEPGSTFKVVTMASALDCGAIDLNTDFYCRGSEQIPGRSQKLHCWKSTGHGAEKTPQALQNSCNIAFAHIALKLGGERFYDYVQRFGILEKTGIDLGGESKGVFFDRSLVTDTEKWGTASLTSGSFGQTFKLTPLQLVRAISAVVNGGKLMEPYIVSEIVDRNGTTVLRQEPTVVRQVIRPETSETMRMLLESVVTEGTAKNAHVAGYSIGGKTGTSEKIDVFDENGQRVQDKIVSFVGVAPMDKPEYIVLVALDTPARSAGFYISGGVMAAPTVGAVLEDILPYLGVSHNYGPEDAAGRTVVMENLQGMSPDEAAARLKEQNLSYEILGQGDRILAQIPGPGAGIPGNGQVLLYLQEQPETRMVKVPDFTGMNRQEAREAAGRLGLYMAQSGNPGQESRIVVTAQSEPAGRELPVGATVRLEFTDQEAAD